MREEGQDSRAGIRERLSALPPPLLLYEFVAFYKKELREKRSSGASAVF